MSNELRDEALAFVRGNPIGHLATIDGDVPWLRVMRAVRIDDDLGLWFVCRASSNKVRQVAANANVEISFWEGGRDLVVSGTAQKVDDAATKQAMWSDDWGRYFDAGKDDPEYCLLRVAPTKALYRDVEQTGFKPQSVL